jgi:hypothetical protein
MLLTVSACGGDDDGLDATKLAGEWHSVENVDEASGVLILDPTNGAGARASFSAGAAAGGAGALTISGSTITIGDEASPARYTASPTEQLVLGPATYERIPHAPRDTFSLPCKATKSAATVLDTPRAALVAMLRDNVTGGVKFFAVPEDVEPGIDSAIDFGASANGAFALSRTEGALGVERIAFGTTGFAAVNALVAYEDRDHDGKLGRFTIDACTDAAVDCIRGVSPLVLAARDGDSAELQAAGYGLMREGWALSVVVPDARRAAGTTIVPLDPGVTVTVPVSFADDPSTVSFPALKF